MHRFCVWLCYGTGAGNPGLIKLLEMALNMVPKDCFLYKHLQFYLASKVCPGEKSRFLCPCYRIDGVKNPEILEEFDCTSKRVRYVFAPYKVLGVVLPGHRISGITTVYPLTRKTVK